MPWHLCKQAMEHWRWHQGADESFPDLDALIFPGKLYGAYARSQTCDLAVHHGLQEIDIDKRHSAMRRVFCAITDVPDWTMHAIMDAVHPAQAPT